MITHNDLSNMNNILKELINFPIAAKAAGLIPEKHIVLVIRKTIFNNVKTKTIKIKGWLILSGVGNSFFMDINGTCYYNKYIYRKKSYVKLIEIMLINTKFHNYSFKDMCIDALNGNIHYISNIYS